MLDWKTGGFKRKALQLVVVRVIEHEYLLAHCPHRGWKVTNGVRLRLYDDRCTAVLYLLIVSRGVISMKNLGVLKPPSKNNSFHMFN